MSDDDGDADMPPVEQKHGETGQQGEHPAVGGKRKADQLTSGSGDEDDGENTAASPTAKRQHLPDADDGEVVDISQAPSSPGGAPGLVVALSPPPSPIVEGETKQRSPPADDPSLTTAVRLLADAKHVGGLIGRGGSVIKKMREDSGTRIEITKSEKGVIQRVITITGIVDVSRNVIHVVVVDLSCIAD